MVVPPEECLILIAQSNVNVIALTRTHYVTNQFRGSKSVGLLNFLRDQPVISLSIVAFYKFHGHFVAVSLTAYALLSSGGVLAK